MIPDSDPWQNHGIRTNPDVIPDGDRLCRNSLLIDSPVRILKIMIQRRYSNPLCQIHMIANSHRADDGIMQSHSGVVADDHIAPRIIDAGTRFHNRIIAQRECTLRRCVHPSRAMNHRMLPPMLVQWRQQSDEPSWSCLHLVHNHPVKELLPLRIVLEPLSEGFAIHPISHL